MIWVLHSEEAKLSKFWSGKVLGKIWNTIENQHTQFVISFLAERKASDHNIFISWEHTYTYLCQFRAYPFQRMWCMDLDISPGEHLVAVFLVD